MLFIIYINDLKTGINSDISKFGDDTMIGRPVKNLDDARMYEKWQMQFNINKCSIMSVGKGNRSVDYTLNDNTLGRSYNVRDLGVQISSDLHSSILLAQK